MAKDRKLQYNVRILTKEVIHALGMRMEAQKLQGRSSVQTAEVWESENKLSHLPTQETDVFHSGSDTFDLSA